jgi:hypothetical protein
VWVQTDNRHICWDIEEIILTCGWISLSDGSGDDMAEGWHGWVGTFTGVALITVAVLPLAALTVWALARR